MQILLEQFEVYTKAFCYLLCLQHDNCLSANFVWNVCFIVSFTQVENDSQSQFLIQNKVFHNHALSPPLTIDNNFCYVNGVLDVENPICRFNARFGYLEWSEWNHLKYNPCSDSQLIWARSRNRRSSKCADEKWLQVYSKEPLFVNATERYYNDALSLCNDHKSGSLFTGFYRDSGAEWSSRTEFSSFYWSGFHRDLTAKEAKDTSREQVIFLK